jgi:catechol 2,3-dioxygenase-like lactoylglutathione lyase family enzyme
MSVPTMHSVVLDCPDPRALAGFYARLLDWPAAEADADNSWATITGPNGLLIEFQRAEDYRPPTWPDAERPQMFHLDLDVSDIEAAHERVIGLGARQLDVQKTFRVYGDPVGHLFCLCIR